MSRTISQIYSEAIYVRNNYLQITELDSGRTKSKMSVLNLMTYVMAVLIYSYETILDVFQVNMAKLIKARMNGTPDWYVTMAMKFQFDSTAGTSDAFGFNGDTLNLEYETVDTTHRIVTQAAWEEYTVHNAIILKVCKDNSDETQVANGAPYMPLTSMELAAFKEYIKAIKFVGSSIYCVSLPPDIITIRCFNASIYYNDTYTTGENVLNNIKAALVNYSQSLEFNQYIYYQAIIDAIQSADNVINIESGIQISVRSYDAITGQYNIAKLITNQYRPSSGYIGFFDADGEPTINLTNLKLTPISQI